MEKIYSISLFLLVFLLRSDAQLQPVPETIRLGKKSEFKISRGMPFLIEGQNENIYSTMQSNAMAIAFDCMVE